MVPVYQIAPMATNSKAVMFNLHVESARVRALDDMLKYRVPALTAVLQLVQDTGEAKRAPFRPKEPCAAQKEL